MQTKRTVTIFMLQIQGCIWAAPLGKWRRKIATGAFFGKQCARHGALVYYQAHFLKMGAPEFSNFLFFSLKMFARAFGARMFKKKHKKFLRLRRSNIE